MVHDLGERSMNYAIDNNITVQIGTEGYTPRYMTCVLSQENGDEPNRNSL